MNAIRKLQIEHAGLGVEFAAYFKAISELKSYLLSNKFAKDTTVQVKDVLLRLAEAEDTSMGARNEHDNAAYRAENEAAEAREARGKSNCERCRSFVYDWYEVQYFADNSWHIVCGKCLKTKEIERQIKGE